MFVCPGDPVYEGMIIGVHSRDNDLTVNPVRTRQLTNIRAAGKDEAIDLTPPIELALERAVEFIEDDERWRSLPNRSVCANVTSRSTSVNGRRAGLRLER